MDTSRAMAPEIGSSPRCLSTLMGWGQPLDTSRALALETRTSPRYTFRPGGLAPMSYLLVAPATETV